VLIEDFSIVCFPYVPEEKDYNITADVVRQVRGEKDHLGPVQIKHARAVTKKRPNQLGAWAGSKNVRQFQGFGGSIYSRIPPEDRCVDDRALPWC